MPPPLPRGPLAKYAGDAMGSTALLERLPRDTEWLLPAGYRMQLNAMGRPQPIKELGEYGIGRRLYSDINDARSLAHTRASDVAYMREPPDSARMAAQSNFVMPDSRWAAGLAADREAFIEWLRLRAAHRGMGRQRIPYNEFDYTTNHTTARYAKPNDALKRYMELSGYDWGDIERYSQWPPRHVLPPFPMKIESTATLDRALRVGRDVRDRLAVAPDWPRGEPRLKTYSAASNGPIPVPSNWSGSVTNKDYIKGNARALRAATYGLGESGDRVLMPYGMDGSLDLRTVRPAPREPMDVEPHPMVYQVDPGAPEQFFIGSHAIGKQHPHVISALLSAAGERGYKGTVQPHWTLEGYLAEMRAKLRADREGMMQDLRRHGLRGRMGFAGGAAGIPETPWYITDYDPAALTVLRQRAKGGSV